MMLGKRLMVVVAVVFLAAPVSAYYDEYDDYEDAHPLRIVAYPVHAAGFALEWIITRPIHALVSQPELVPVFGHRPYEFSFADQETGLPQITGPTTVPPPPAAMDTADIEATRRAAEEARAAAENAQAAAEDARRSAEEAARAAEKSTRAFDRSLLK